MTTFTRTPDRIHTSTDPDAHDVVVTFDPHHELSVSDNLLDTYDVDLDDDEYDRRDNENQRRVDVFTAVLEIALAEAAAEHDVTVSVCWGDESQATYTLVDPDDQASITVEELVWQSAQDRIGTGERAGQWTAWI